MISESKLTPMMAQYRRIKSELPPDALLLFRLGDFYEMFFEDAQTGAQLLNVALTRRGTTPMCGIPFHAAPGYLAKLLKAGKKVAICDQVEEARPGQLVKREVTQILSPGTHLDERLLAEERNNYLAAVYRAEGKYGLAVVDLTTSEFKATEVENQGALLAETQRLRPAELICADDDHEVQKLFSEHSLPAQSYEGWAFAFETAFFTLKNHFKVATLDGFGLKNKVSAIGAAGGVLHYLSQHLRRDIQHLTRLTCYESSDYLGVDPDTLRNLEVIETLHPDAPKTGSLFGALNRTVTPMGARRLREWLSQPLSSAEGIRRRQEAVGCWLAAPAELAQFREALKTVRDLERTLSRLSMGSGNARDLLALKSALEQAPCLKAVLREVLLRARLRETEQCRETFFPEELTGREFATSLIERLESEISEGPDLVELLSKAITDEPPLSLKEGGLIRDGFDPHLDELRGATRGGKEWVARLQQQEIERTGIPSLKIRFNSVFGYYIEVTRSNLDRVPAQYIRKQTIANGERFITEELKEMENKILGAEERSAQLEAQLFQQVRERVLSHLEAIQTTAQALGQLDVLAAFAETARLFSYCRPEVRDEGVIQIQDGRHPVLDQAVSGERFVPNDTTLDLAEQQILVITGPNMAGKSTYIRQVALLALLAHAGSFIPAASARIDLVDRIFTRIGASDNLARGQSTFMVEMTEMANILNTATRRSLVILDEIGRGTSTFDGLSLAWSIVEFLHHQTGAKTLFASHYHELTELAERLPRVRNHNVAVREWNDQIIFLHKIVPGGADRSYGIQVARLAGVPQPVLARAREILSNLEASDLTPEGKPKGSSGRRAEREKLKRLAPSSQLDLFA